MRAHFKQAPTPKLFLDPGTSRFPFQDNIYSTMLHFPITSRATEGELQQLEVSQGGFSPGLGPPAVKTPSGKTEGQGGIMARCLHHCLQGWDVEQCGTGAVSVLSAREGFPEAPITGLCNLCSFPLLRLLL